MSFLGIAALLVALFIFWKWGPNLTNATSGLDWVSIALALGFAATLWLLYKGRVSRKTGLVLLAGSAIGLWINYRAKNPGLGVDINTFNDSQNLPGNSDDKTKG